MRVLLIRHAKAEDGSASGADSQRALTPEGRKDTHKAVRALRSLVQKTDVLASSPLVRAQQTAEILAAGFDDQRVTEVAALSPGTPATTLLAWLLDQPIDATVMLVGHEPDLSCFAGLLLSGDPRSVLELKKGAACLIEFKGRVQAGRGCLLWALTPKQLRALST
ncbi:MAG: phosphohistidine phosphatase SixA [Pseudomonadota bacterium]|nr:MAG: phosphohistidine phosphatase SixA [Pseudomonadota bacterium]